MADQLIDDLYEIGFYPESPPHPTAKGFAAGDRVAFALAFYAEQPLRLVHNRANEPKSRAT